MLIGGNMIQRPCHATVVQGFAVSLKSVVLPYMEKSKFAPTEVMVM